MADTQPKPETVAPAPTDAVPDTKKSEVLVKVVGPAGTTGFQGSHDGSDENVVHVTDEPTVLSSKTLADKVIKLAAEYGVQIAYVDTEQEA